MKSSHLLLLLVSLLGLTISASAQDQKVSSKPESEERCNRSARFII